MGNILFQKVAKTKAVRTARIWIGKGFVKPIMAMGKWLSILVLQNNNELAVIISQFFIFSLVTTSILMLEHEDCYKTL